MRVYRAPALAQGLYSLPTRRCNQEELEDYFYGMPNPEEIREMSLELDEFLQAVVATANLQPANIQQTSSKPPSNRSHKPAIRQPAVSKPPTCQPANQPAKQQTNS